MLGSSNATLYRGLFFGVLSNNAPLIVLLPTKYSGRCHGIPFFLFIYIVLNPKNLDFLASVMSDHINLLKRFNVMPLFEIVRTAIYQRPIIGIRRLMNNIKYKKSKLSWYVNNDFGKIEYIAISTTK